MRTLLAFVPLLGCGAMMLLCLGIIGTSKKTTGNEQPGGNEHPNDLQNEIASLREEVARLRAEQSKTKAEG